MATEPSVPARRRRRRLLASLDLLERCARGWRQKRLRRLHKAPRALAVAAQPAPEGGEPPAKRQRREILPPTEPVPADEVGRWGEESRLQVGLELLGEVAPESAKWTYPLADERWRCFAGYLPAAVRGVDKSDHFFQLVKEGTQWSQPSGRWGLLPLKTAWMTASPCSCVYGYGGARVSPEHYPDWMQEIMGCCMPLCGLTTPAEWPNSCNLNWYVDGGHSVGWHSDNESLFQGKDKDCRIISLSLGQERKFELKCKGGGLHKLMLGDGDLCTMEGLTQKHYQHRVPKEFGKGIAGRINLTWRWVVEHTPDCAVRTAAVAAPQPAIAAPAA